jgi:hypothetical protein
MNVKVLLGVVAGLLVAVLVAVIVVINQLSAQERQADYERCMASYGYTADSIGGDLDGAIDAAEACSN